MWKVLVALPVIIMLFVCGCSEHAGIEEDVAPLPTTTAVITSEERVASPSPTAEEDGFIQLYPGGEYHAGDMIRISGTTNLHPGNRLLIEVTSVSFYPTNKSEDARFYGISDVVTVERGVDDRHNTWVYTLDTTDLAPDRYTVQVSGITTKTFRKSSYFELLP